MVNFVDTTTSNSRQVTAADLNAAFAQVAITAQNAATSAAVPAATAAAVAAVSGAAASAAQTAAQAAAATATAAAATYTDGKAVATLSSATAYADSIGATAAQASASAQSAAQAFATAAVQPIAVKQTYSHRMFLAAADYGVLANGVTDDTTAWEAALAALRNLTNGGILVHPGGRSIISRTLRLDQPGMKLRGGGRGGFLDTNPIAPSAATLAWAGPSSGIMVYMGPASGATRGVVDLELTGIRLDSGTGCSTGLQIASALHSLVDVFTSEFTTQGVVCNCYDGISDWGTTSFNRISVRGRQINTAGVLLRLNGNGTLNTCFNEFPLVAGEFSSSIFLDLGDCDNNLFHQVYAQRASGTGFAAVFNAGGTSAGSPGSARNNRIINFSTSIQGAPIYAAGTGPSTPAASGPNYIDHYDSANAALNLTTGPGAQCYIGSNTLPPGIIAHNDSMTGGYRITIDGHVEWWATTALVGAGTFSGYTFPVGIFKEGVTGVMAVPVGNQPGATYSINTPSATGFQLVTGNGGSATGYWYLRAWGR